MQVATWNVHGGHAVHGGAIQFSKALENHSPDLIALQEFPNERGAELAKHIGLSLGLPHSVYWGINAAEDETGLAIISRWKILDTKIFLAEPPPVNLTADSEKYEVFAKGALNVILQLPTGKMSFSAVHLLPFHIFDLDEDHPAARLIWDRLSARLVSRGDTPILIAGDFNGPEALRVSPSALLTRGVRSSVNDNLTRSSGQSHDDILYDNSFELERIELVPSQSDHFLCIAKFRGGAAEK